MTTMTFADCRAAARAVRAAEYGRQAVAVVRPRSVLGIVRSRGPLSIVLLVADVEGRLVRSAPDSFALVERPQFVGRPAAARGGVGLRLLRLIDRRWDTLLFTVPPLVALAAAITSALVAIVHDVPPSPAIVWPALFALVYVSVFMVSQLVNESVWLRRTLGRTAPAPDELAAESYPGWNWSMPLCHHTGPGDGSRLLRLASARMEDLVERQARLHAEADGFEQAGGRVREVLVCLTHGVTTSAMRRVVAATLYQPYGPDSRVALRRPLGPVEDYRAPVRAGGGFWFLWVGGIAVVVAVLAVFVASIERQACAGGPCAGRPATYLTAAQWLAWRLLWQNAPGITPATWPTLTFGWLLSVVALMTVPVTWLSVRLAVDRHRGVLDDFARWRNGLANARVLLLTVTPTERDAALRAVRQITGQQPQRPFTGQVVVHELGAIGRTTLGLAQCARPGGGGPGGAQATATEAIRQWRPDLIIMIGICYGLREDWNPPQRLTDVIVATAIHDLDRRIEYDDRTELLGDRVSTGSAIVSRLQAASIDWHTAPVSFGLLLSAQMLVDSAQRRDELKAQHSRALGGEMEAQGLYAAAADAGVPWIVVKAISDWGVDREEHYRPAEAAANAAGFVAHAVAVGAFDDLPNRRAAGGRGRSS
jgi:nucleoside phosphorylase